MKTSIKTCFKCGVEKPLSYFYKHKQMADGHVNKCKECNKADVIKNRKSRVEYYREYDRVRGNRQGAEYSREYRSNNPLKYKAHTAVNNAIRDGRLVKLPCRDCGTLDKVHGHHKDYTNLLDVIWLCPAHHKEEHKG
jgi:hypothetical protein